MCLLSKPKISKSKKSLPNRVGFFVRVILIAKDNTAININYKYITYM